VLRGDFGGRGAQWKVSWRVIRDRPWFEFDNLSVRWLRPLVGYGPDLFRSTYLLESPPAGSENIPEEPSHAHNYFIHQTVEQGYLGLSSSLGIFIAVFLIGFHQLFVNGKNLSHVHKLVLIGLLATLAGRFLEMMVGIARVSDLTILWVILAAFAALPAVMGEPQSQKIQATELTRPRDSRRRERRHLPLSSKKHISDWSGVLRLTFAAFLIGGIGTLALTKSVNYVRAAVIAGEGVKHVQSRQLPEALSDFNRAIQLAPDVPSYYTRRAQTYFAFRGKESTHEEGCELRKDIPYELCLRVREFENNLINVAKNPFQYRSRWGLARSAYDLKLLDESIIYYKETLGMIPGSWRMKNQLAGVYIEAKQPEDAVHHLEESLAIEKKGKTSLLLGIAYRDMGKKVESDSALEDSIAMGLWGDDERNARLLLFPKYQQSGLAPVPVDNPTDLDFELPGYGWFTLDHLRELGWENGSRRPYQLEIMSLIDDEGTLSKDKNGDFELFGYGRFTLDHLRELGWVGGSRYPYEIKLMRLIDAERAAAQAAQTQEPKVTPLEQAPIPNTVSGDKK